MANYKTFTLTTGRTISAGDDPQVIFGDEMELIDGSRIKCHLKAELPEVPSQPDNISLDTTGTYLVIGNTKRQKNDSRAKEEQKRQHDEQIAAEKHFAAHIPLFLQHADRILSDSRMFLAPVPVQSGLAYSGTSGFRKPTLGIYVEWWKYFKASHCHSNDGEEGVVWYIAGSPLSGSNKCGVCIGDEGWRFMQIHNFIDTWSSFMYVNRRYREAKEVFEAYTLDEVIARLSL